MCAFDNRGGPPRIRVNLQHDRRHPGAPVQNFDDDEDSSPDLEQEMSPEQGETSDALLQARAVQLREFLMQAEWMGPLRDLRQQFSGALVCLAGGSLRDAMIGREYKDLDFTVFGVAEEDIIAYLSQAGQVTKTTKEFDALKYRPNGYDGAGEDYYLDVNMPRWIGENGPQHRRIEDQTEPRKDIEDDLFYRDFTINAIAMDISTGEIIDPTGGWDDLKNGIVRATKDPDRMIDIGPGQMLRGLRFACKYTFDLDPATEEAITRRIDEIHLVQRDSGSGSETRAVSWEAQGKEFGKSLDANPERTLHIWDRTGALAQILPEVKDMQQPEVDPTTGFNDWEITRLTLAQLSRDASLQLKFAALFHRLGKNGNNSATVTNEISRRISLTQFSGRIDKKELPHLVRFHSAVEVDQLPMVQLEVVLFDKQGLRHDLVELMRAVAAATGQDGLVMQSIMSKVDRIQRVLEQTGGSPLLNGGDLIKGLGMRPGPQIKLMLDGVRDAQLRGEVVDKEQALEFVRHHLAE